MGGGGGGGGGLADFFRFGTRGSDRFVGRGERVRCSTVTSKILLSGSLQLLSWSDNPEDWCSVPQNFRASSAAGAKILRNRPLPCDFATSGGAFATAQDLKNFWPAFGGREILPPFRPQEVPFRPLKSPTPLPPPPTGGVLFMGGGGGRGHVFSPAQNLLGYRFLPKILPYARPQRCREFDSFGCRIPERLKMFHRSHF